MTITFRTKTAKGWTVDAAYTPFTFPDGAAHLKGTDVDPTGAIAQIADIRGHNPQDLFHLALWADFFSAYRDPGKIVVLMPYLPGARMDRGEPRGALLYANFLNDNLPDNARIVILDPHSPVMPKMINANVVEYPFERIIRRELGVRGDTKNSNYVGVIAPDKGAIDRATRAANVLHVPVFKAEKTRDFETGKLSGFTCEELPKEGKLLLVDDICDGGGTFVGLADTLLSEQGINRDRLDLWVTHGIFSKGFDDLLDRFGHIHTTDSYFQVRPHSVFIPEARGQVSIYPVLPYLTGEIGE